MQKRSFTNNYFSYRIGWWLLLAGVFFVYACKTKQKIVLNNGKCILDYKNARTLSNNLKANEFNFSKMNAKLTIESMIDSSSNTFSVSLRIKRDSVIWMSISKFGVEGARVLITRDSVKLFTSLPEKKYFKGDFSYISKLLNTEMDFEIVQSLLMGNSVAFYDEDEKLKPGTDNCQYTLGTIRKHKLRRVMNKGKDLKESAQSIYMHPGDFKITRILFYEFNPDRSLDVKYSEYTKADSVQLFPNKINLTFKADKTLKLDLTYTKTDFAAEQTFPFHIPEGYEQIIYHEKK